MVQLGVPGLTPSQDSRFYFNYHHTAADTLDKGQCAAIERECSGDGCDGICAC